MDIDGAIGFDPSGVVEAAEQAERVGYDGIWSAETGHDPSSPGAGRRAHRAVATGHRIAVAFARNPMTLAMLANDSRPSRGRFMLGLGSQIKPHIEKRFSMPWSHPAPRMRELILAIRAICRVGPTAAAWRSGASSTGTP